MDRIAPRELIRPSVVDERSAFDLQALAFLVAAVLGGVFVILFLLAFLPWLLAGALTAAVESLMRQLGFSKFTVDGIGDWVLVFVASRRDRGPAAPARSQVPAGNRGANGAGEGPLRETVPYEERTVDELYAEARYRDIPGRSQMKKAELIRALRRQ